MSRLTNILGGLSIGRRLTLLFVSFAFAMAVVAWTLSALTTSTVNEIAGLERSLERRSAIVDLESAIGDYAAQLDARQGLILNRDFRSLRTLKHEIEIRFATVARRAERLKELDPELDVASIEALVGAFRAAHDEYLRAATEGDVVVAAARHVDVRTLRDAIHLRVVTITAAWSSEFDNILGVVAKISRHISLTLGASLTVMISGTALMFALMVFSVMRPLSRLNLAVERLDRPGEPMPPLPAGPAEFRAIGRALSGLRQRLRVQQAAEDRLRRSEGKLRQFLESSADMFWEMGSDLRFTWMYSANGNDGGDPDKVLGRTRWELVGGNPDEDPLWFGHRETMLERKPFRNFEYPAYSADGTPQRWVNVNGVPVFEPDGTFIGYRGTAVDVTEQKAVAEHLRQTQSQEALGRLTGGVAHDFNNLLTVLRSNLDLLQRHTKLEQPLAQMIERCMRAIDRGARLTSQLLAFGRRQTLQPTAVALSHFLDEFGQLVRRTMPASIAVHVEVEEALPAVHVDPSRLQDALLNLALNARDAMPEGGTLTLRAMRTEPHAEAPLAETDHPQTEADARVSIVVSDTGTGIADDAREKVFEPFFTTKMVGEGTGLGLSMVRGFVEQSSGSVHLSSRLGMGTTIRLDLPVSAQESRPPPRETASGSFAAGRGETILLVEDEDDVRASIASILNFLGYSVICCASGEDAVDTLDRCAHEIDLVLSDVLMPGQVQGDDLAVHIRERHPMLPVILMCGYTSDLMREEIGALGVPVLDKPVATETLQRALSEGLKGRTNARGEGVHARATLG